MAQFNLRLKDDMDKKLKIISDESRRSKNKQIEFIIEQFIKDYERVKGEVKDK